MNKHRNNDPKEVVNNIQATEACYVFWNTVESMADTTVNTT